MVRDKKKQTKLSSFFGKAIEKEIVPVNVDMKDKECEIVIESEEIDDEEEEVDEESEEEIIVNRRKRKRIIQDSSSEEEPLQQIKQLKQCDDIHDEELNFLDKSDILQERTRGKQVSRYSEALKKLTDKKSRLEKYQGEKGPMDDYLSQEEDEGEEEESSDEEGFIVDDDMIDGEKNTDMDSEMNLIEMPAEFTYARSQSFSKQLSIYIEYLIELSLNPNYNILTNNRFKIAKNAVIKRVQSYKDSMVTSDVWLTSFKEAVDKYSIWTFKTDFNGTLYKCDACRANKPASYRVLLSSDHLPSQVTLNLGSECCRKGEMYHKFYHFQLHIYNKVKNQVVTEMMSNGLLNNQNIHEYLIETGYTKKLIKEIKSLFSQVNQVYNKKSQRTKIVEDTSSEYSSSED